MSESGLDHVLASLSARQAKEKGLLTSGTCGQHGSISSNSAALQQFLASKLREEPDLFGSIWFWLIWKVVRSPAGRRICALRVYGNRIGAVGFIGWQTPRARGDAGGRRWRKKEAVNLGDQVRIFALDHGLTEEEVSRLSLSPTFVRRLMGFPKEWESCAGLATPSSRRSVLRLCKLICGADPDCRVCDAKE